MAGVVQSTYESNPHRTRRGRRDRLARPRGQAQRDGRCAGAGAGWRTASPDRSAGLCTGSSSREELAVRPGATADPLGGWTDARRASPSIRRSATSAVGPCCPAASLRHRATGLPGF